MKIKYTHISDPSEIRVYDTERALKNNPFIHMDQETFDKHELKNMDDNLMAGMVLSYEVIEEDIEK